MVYPDQSTYLTITENLPSSASVQLIKQSGLCSSDVNDVQMLNDLERKEYLDLSNLIH